MDPCGHAPGGIWSGAGALSCRKYESRQVVPFVDMLAYCSECDATSTAENIRRQTVINFWEEKKEAKRAAKQQKK
jgi:hypothetical protein